MAAAPTSRPPTGGRKPGQKNKFSAATISRDLREMAMMSFHGLGGVKYLMRVGKTDPSAYLSFLGKCLVKDDASSTGGLVLNVVQLSSPAQPTPGVLNSPVVENIAPQRQYLQLVERDG